MRVTILTTGGTIDKTYDEHDGSLRNTRSVLEVILASLRLPDLSIRHRAVMRKDSLYMCDEDRRRILAAVREVLPDSEAVLVLHGTDTLSVTGDLLRRELPDLVVPVILTGAMRPFEFRDTDAVQNVTESLLAARLVRPGVWVVLHNRALRFPGVVKDRERLTFTMGEEGSVGEQGARDDGAAG